MLLALLLASVTFSPIALPVSTDIGFDIPIDFIQHNGTVEFPGINNQSHNLVAIRIDLTIEADVTSFVTNLGNGPCVAWTGGNPAIPELQHNFSGVNLFRHNGDLLASRGIILQDVFAGIAAFGDSALLEQHQIVQFRNVAILTDPLDIETFTRAIVSLQYARYGQTTTSCDNNFMCTEMNMVGAHGTIHPIFP